MNQFSDNFLWMRTFENEVFLEGLANGRCNWFLPFHCKKSIKHIFVAWVSLTKNLQFREMQQPPNGWQSINESISRFENIQFSFVNN